MPWKQGYTISDERSLTDSELRWPDGARCCVAMTVDLSVASGPEGVTAADLTTPEALFGANQGLAALREVLRRHAMRATFAAPAIIAHIHRDLVRSLTAEGHEIAAHGFRHEDVSGLERDEERQRIARTTEILADVTGRKPAGWFSLPRQGDRYAVGAVSPNTVDLLLEAGYLYLGNGLADDIPHYWVSDFTSRRALLTLPYYYPLRRPVLPDVPAQGDRPRTPGRAAAQLARRVCGAIQARPVFPHDLAPATHRLVQPTANA